MDARAAVLTAAVACLVAAVAFNVGALTATGGMDPQFIGNAGVASAAITIGLFAGAGLYARVDKVGGKVERLEGIVQTLTQEIGNLRKDIGTHKAHDVEALFEAAHLDDTGPQGVRHLRG